MPNFAKIGNRILRNFINDIRTSAFLAWKSIIRGNRAVLILTPVIIGFSIANLVFSSSLFDGMIASLNRQLINNLFAHVLVEPPEDDAYLFSADNLTQKIRSIPGVENAAIHLKTSGRFTFDPEKDNRDSHRGSYQITGVDPDVEKNVTGIAAAVIEGRYLEPDDRDDILIGAEVAGGGLGSFEKISLKGVRVGDEVRVTYPNGRTRNYTVRGIFKTGLDGIDVATFVTRKEIEAVIGASGATNEILVRLTDPENTGPAIEHIRPLIPADARIGSWDTFSNFAATMSNSFSILNFINSAISLIISCTTIFIVIFINVVNKRRQLGILKAIGVRESLIITSYIFQTLFYGLMGTAVGFIIVYGVADTYFTRHPLDMGFAKVTLLINMASAFQGVAMIVLAGVFAGFLPAWLTVRQSIIKAIWGS